MSVRGWSSLSLVALVACGGGSDGASFLKVSAFDADLLVIREGGDWQPIELDMDARAELLVTGPYELVRVCDDGRGTSWTRAVLAGVRADAGELVLDCSRRPFGAQVTVSVVGAERSEVYLANQAALIQSGQPRALFGVDLATYDLVVVSDLPRKLVIRHGVAVSGPTSIDIDLATEGVDLVARAVELEPFATAGAWLRTTRGTGATLPAEGSQLWLPPMAVLDGGDIVYATMAVTSVPAQRQRRVAPIDPASTTPVTVSVPPPLTTFSFETQGVTSARWSGSGQWDWATVAVMDGANGASATWQVDAHRPSRPEDPRDELAMPDVTSIPGWDPFWTVTDISANWSLQLENLGDGFETEQLTAWAPSFPATPRAGTGPGGAVPAAPPR